LSLQDSFRLESSSRENSTDPRSGHLSRKGLNPDWVLKRFLPEELFFLFFAMNTLLFQVVPIFFTFGPPLCGPFFANNNQNERESLKTEGSGKNIG
jgi:hypothetical protein